MLTALNSYKISAMVFMIFSHQDEFANVTGFGKINHFVTFDTSNIHGQNNALSSW